MQRMNVERREKDRKADGEGRMVTPWHSKIVGGLKVLSLLLRVRSRYSARMYIIRNC